MDCMQIHETIVRDVFDVLSNVKDFDQVEWLNKRNSVGSIARRTSNLILVFPVIVSNSLSIETASIISKAIERKCVSLLQILFSSIQMTEYDNLQDYISQFHTNLDLKNGIDLGTFIDVMDKMVEEGAVEVSDYDIYNAVKEDMRNINFTLSESFNPVAINDFKVKENMYNEQVVLEANSPKEVTFKYDGYSRTMPYDKYKDTVEKYAGRKVDEYKKNHQQQIRVNNNVNKGLKDQVDLFRYQLSQPQVDKLNELMPTIMLVNFISHDKKSGSNIDQTGIIGVKAKLYPVDGMEIVTRLSSKYKDKNGLFNLIRATTREISFFRDIAFMIDKAKLDAINMGSNSSNAKMFKVLERRAAKNKFTTLLKKNDASPITSLVLSNDEVEYLKKYNNIDLDKPYIARTILEGFNLMDITIADESIEIAKFLFDDGDGIYETIPFDALEKQAKDNSYKKIVNLVSKLNR